MTFDARRNAFWFAYMGSSQTDYLYEFELATHTLTRSELPPTDHNGFLGRVAVAPDGSVWLTEEYRVVRFDPASGTMLSLKLAETDADAVYGGSPGTWPSAIAFDSKGQTLIARHGLASLLVLDRTLDEVGRIPLPKAYGSVGDLVEVDGRIYTAADDGRTGVAILDEDGTIASQTAFAAYRLVGVGHRVLGLGQSGAAWLEPPASIARIDVTPHAEGDRIGALDDGSIIVYFASAGVLEHVAPDGSITARVEFPRTAIQIANPAGQSMTAYTMHRISAMAVGSAGEVWLIDETAGDLVRVEI
jgi:streptogramin lyase